MANEWHSTGAHSHQPASLYEADLFLNFNSDANPPAGQAFFKNSCCNADQEHQDVEVEGAQKRKIEEIAKRSQRNDLHFGKEIPVRTTDEKTHGQGLLGVPKPKDQNTETVLTSNSSFAVALDATSTHKQTARNDLSSRDRASGFLSVGVPFVAMRYRACEGDELVMGGNNNEKRERRGVSEDSRGG